MTKTLARDPARRCLKPDAWPEQDRQLWCAALQPGDVLEPGGRRAAYRPSSNRKVAAGYGRWLAYLAYRGMLNQAMHPAERITPAAVAEYVGYLQGLNRRQTILCRLQELYESAQVMGPGQDWQWLRRIESRIRAREPDGRGKRCRLVAAADLYTLGRQLMETAAEAGTNRQQAVQYRDGLAISLLAARPMRRRNLAALRLNHHVVLRGDVWWISIPGTQTKSGAPIEMPWPEDLDENLQVWLSTYRPSLAAATGRWHRPAADALWVSTHGSPMTEMALYDRICERTQVAFGRSLSPHLFRDCAATSIAIHDPAHVRIAATLLGHRNLATTERFYNQAQALQAARHWHEVIANLREETP